MPITHPKYVNDFKLVFKNRSFSISKCLFGLYSGYFREHPSFLKQSLDLTQKSIDVSTFEQFVKACQSHFYIINNDNCFDLLFLCTKFDVQVIKDEVSLYISNIDDVLSVISKLKSIVNKDDQDIDDDELNLVVDIENTIAKKINLYLNQQSFVTLPISNLASILSKSFSFQKSNAKLASTNDNSNNGKNTKKSSNYSMQIDSHLLFTFFLSAFQFHKESSIILIDLVEDYGQFTKGEIDTLIANTDFANNLVNPILQRGLSSITNQTSKQIDQFNDLKNRLKALQTGTTKHINKVEKKVNNLKSEFESFKLASSSQLTSSNSIAKSQFSFTVPSSFSKITVYEEKNDKEITINLNNSNATQILNEIQSQFDDFQKTIDESNETMETFKETYEEIASMADQLNSEFDESLKSLHSGIQHKQQQQSSKSEKKSESVIMAPKKNNLSFREPKKSSAYKGSTKALSFFQKKSPSKSSLDSLGPTFWDMLFAESKAISCQYDANINQNNNNDGLFLTDDPFDGIFNLLSKKIGGSANLHEANIIDIQASSSTVKSPSLLCDANSVWYWSSNNDQRQWVKFDFKKIMIKVTHYSIQTILRNPQSTHLKNWILEGTNAKGFTSQQVQKDDPAIKWETLDQRTNDTNLNGLSKIYTYEVKSSNKFFRYIRLKTTGPNHYGNYILALRRIEFFGTIMKFNEKGENNVKSTNDLENTKQ